MSVLAGLKLYEEGASKPSGVVLADNGLPVDAHGHRLTFRHARPDLYVMEADIETIIDLPGVNLRIAPRGGSLQA